MTSQLNLSQAEIARIQAAVAPGDASSTIGKYTQAYQTIIAIDDAHKAQGESGLDSKTRFWFEQAAAINANDATSNANLFIRDVTAAGLLLDGKSASNMQAVSNAIGYAVINEIANGGGIPPIGTMISADIGNAISDQGGGQSIGGWGGSFYYWNEPYSFNPDGTVKSTVGQAILSSPAEYEKFVTVNAKALSDSLAFDIKSGDLQAAKNIVNDFGTGAEAQAPTSVVADILNRAVNGAMTGSYAGNPDIINYLGNPAVSLGFKNLDSVWTRNTDGTWSTTLSDGSSITADSATTAALDGIRDARLGYQPAASFTTLPNDATGVLKGGFNDNNGDSVLQFADANTGKTDDVIFNPTDKATINAGGDRNLIIADGDNQTINAGGKDDQVIADGSNSTLNLGANSSATLNGQADVVNASVANLTLGTGSSAQVFGAYNNLVVGAGTNLTVVGDGEKIDAAEGAKVRASGSGEALSGTGAIFTLDPNSTAVLNGDSNTLNISAGSNVQAFGALNKIAESNGNVFTADSNTKSVQVIEDAAGKTFSLDDYNDDGSHTLTISDVASGKTLQQVDTAADGSYVNTVTNADGTYVAHYVDENGSEYQTEHLASDGDTVLDAHGISAAGKTWSETVTNGQIAASFGGQQVNWSDAAVAGAGALGSAIGNALGGNNLALKIAGSTIIGTMSQDLAVALVNGSNTIVTGEAAAAGMGDGIGAAMGSAFGTFGVNLANNANGEVSGLLVGEAAQALGLKGFGAGLFNTVGTTITSTLIRSAYGTLTTGIDFGTELATNFGDKFIVGMEANIGGFLGSYLGAALVPATSQAAAIGGSIGSAVGTAIGATASVTAAIEATVIGEALTAAIPFIGPFLAPFLGAFVGQILGTLFGGLFASGPPKATVAAGVDFSTGQARVVYQSTKNGGDPTFILGLAQSVSNEINAIVGATGGKIVAESANNYIEFYQKDSNIRVTGFDSQQTNYNAPSTNSAVWANIVDANALGLVKGASVANGDIVLEAALGSALHKDGALSEIATDLQVAKDYETYLANSDAIDTLMAANPDSSFTAGWTLTLLRAKELGLNLLTVQSGWTATLSGDSEKVYDAKGALVEELDFSATGVAAPFYYYDKRTVSSSNSVIHVANGATVTVTGSGNIIDAGLRANVIVLGDGNSLTLAQGATATVNGKNETIKAAGATVNVGSNGSATINGDSATVNVGTNANATLTGRGANIYVNGTDDVLSASNAVIRLAANTWTHNIAGDGNQIIAQGAGVAVGVSGRGDQVTLQANSGSAVGLNGVDGLTINATGDNVYVNSSNTGTQLNGSGNNVVVTGVGNSLTATNNSIDIANNSFLNLAGGFDNVRLGGIGAYLGLLGGSGYNVSGSNATIGTLGGTSLNLSGGNDTVGLGGTGDYLGVLSGSGHMVTGSGNLINVVSGAGVSFLGSSNVINGGTNVSLAVTGNYNTIAAGSGSTISLGAGTNTLYTSNNRVTLQNGASATVNGNRDTVVQTTNSWMQVNGSVGWVDITGGGNTTNVNSAWVVLENGASTTLNGNSNTANLNSWAYVNATGAWDTINVNGVGDGAVLNNGTLNIADGSVVTVWGSGDRINVGSNVILKVLGSNNVITVGNLSLIGVDGSSNAISAGNNVSVALVGNSNSVSLGSQVSVGAGGSSDLFKIGNQANIAVRGNQNTVISGIQSDIVISGILDTVQAGSQSMVGAAGSRNSVSVGAGSSIGMGGQQSALLNQLDQIVNAMSGFSAPDPTMLNIPLIGQATAPIQLAVAQH